MIDSMTLMSEDPRVTAVLAIVALGRDHPQHARLALGPILPNVDATILSILDPLIRDAEALGSHDPAAAKAAARQIFSVLRPTLDDVAAWRDDIMSQARNIIREALRQLPVAEFDVLSEM